MINEKVFKKVLKNGLTVLVIPRHRLPKVSFQLWYNVGSKDEKSGEKGIAHLIEHMIFKGTSTLTESDINAIVHKLSGSCNAFTSHDYTGYLFDVPSQHWKEIMPIMADSMKNCTFKEDLLNSELKAVIQELKMYNDDYASSLVEVMIGQMFADHPYHYPIIGYKQDLWNLQRTALLRFYEKHYIPNNATLVVVGDIDVNEIYKEAQDHFGTIQPHVDYKKDELYHSFDLVSQSVTLYRDIQQPLFLIGWVIPGVRSRLDYHCDVLSWLVGAGKGSILNRILMDELELVTEVESFVYDLFDYSVFFIHFEPKNMDEVDMIIEIIYKEIEKLTKEISTIQLTRAIKKTEIDFLSLVENNQKSAYLLGKYFTALQDEHYLENYTNCSEFELIETIQAIIKKYIRPAVMYRGEVLPLSSKEHEFWRSYQEQSDKEDARVLAKITRDTSIEAAHYAHKVEVKSPKPFKFLNPLIHILPNGLKIIYCHTPALPKIEILLDFKYKHYYDPDNIQGLGLLTADVLQEGVEGYTAAEFAQYIESFGMELNTFPGHLTLSMLSRDFVRGLDIIKKLVTQALCNDDSIEKVREQLFAEIKSFWDNPAHFAGQLMRDLVYKKHPYHKNVMGNFDTIKNISPADVKQLYISAYTPRQARLVIVGDLSNYDVPVLVQEHLGLWINEKLEDIIFPSLQPVLPDTINYAINRDQIVLGFGGLSVSRTHADFDVLLLFDQIFTGGVLGSMSSRLFALREQSGLFYTIGGSLVAGSDKDAGMVFIKTIVSNDRLEEAEARIRTVINNAVQSCTENELLEAKRALFNSMVDNFATLKQMAAAFLFLDRFGYEADYFEKRPGQLASISRDQIIHTVPNYLNTDHMLTLRIGRV